MAYYKTTTSDGQETIKSAELDPTGQWVDGTGHTLTPEETQSLTQMQGITPETSAKSNDIRSLGGVSLTRDEIASIAGQDYLNQQSYDRNVKYTGNVMSAIKEAGYNPYLALQGGGMSGGSSAGSFSSSEMKDKEIADKALARGTMQSALGLVGMLLLTAAKIFLK